MHRLKVHGDYLDPDLKNTVEELGSYAPPIDALLDQVFDQYGLVVCGWSADWDEALRNALRRAASRRYGTYWAHVGSLGEQARRLIAHRQAVAVPIPGADEFFETLAAKIAALAEAMDQRPLSTALAVAELKRYLPDPRHRIRLHDLLMDETNRVTERSHFPNSHLQPTPELVQQRLREYEAAAGTLVALLIHGGYFADRPEHDELLVNVLRRLASRPSEQGRFVLWVNAHQYPTLLALYALGLGALHARRPVPLARALATIRIQAPGGQLPLGRAASSWRVLDHGVMSSLPGLEKRKTPISDYLHDRLRDPARPILPDENDYDEVFDQLEYLLGVVYAHARGDSSGPIGRFVWRRRDGDGSVPDELLVAHGEALVSIGLFDGQRETLDSAKAAYDEWVSRSGLSW